MNVRHNRHIASGRQCCRGALGEGPAKRLHRQVVADEHAAETDLAAGKCDLVAFGRPFLANPDFVARSKAGAAMNAPDPNTFYTGDAKGYTDYPVLG